MAFFHLRVSSCFYSSCLGFRVPRNNAIFHRCMNSSLSKTFELPTYAAGLANLLTEAPSPPPSRIRPFNKLVEDYVDIEAEEGEVSNRHGSSSC